MPPIYGSQMSLWLSLFLPDLPLEVLELGDAKPAPTAEASPSGRVVYERAGARRWVIGCRHPRIAAGETLGSVQARFPNVRPQPRNGAAEAAALQSLASLAYRINDRVVITREAPRAAFDSPSNAVSVDIAPSLRLFGGLQGVLDEAARLTRDLPYRVQLGVAPSLEAALLTARAGLGPTTSPTELAGALAPLPIALMRWPLEAESLLLGSGHRSLGDVLNHDPAALSSRLGPEFPRALQRLLGSLPDPRPWFVPPARYRRRLDLDTEIDSWHALLFPLRRLFDEFEAYLRARQVNASELTVILARRRSEGERFVLRSTTPTQSAAIFLRLLREHWSTRPPSAAASELRLRADRFAELAPPQTSLFDNGTQGNDAWNATLDRLRTRLGDGQLWQPGLTADHRPERAWSPNGSVDSKPFLPERPLWLLREPRAWTPPPAGTLANDPERISGGWWDDAPVERDYYRATDHDGQTLWIYRDRRDGRWYLQGLELPGESG